MATSIRNIALLQFDAEALLLRLTPRERWMVTALLATLLSAAVYLSFDWAATQRDAYTLAQADRLDARRQLRLAGRGGVSALERAQLDDLKRLSIEARTLSIARIVVERKLAAAAERAALVTPAIRVAESTQPDAVAPVLSAEVSAPYTPASLLAFLDQVAAEPEAAFVESVSVTEGAPGAMAGNGGQMRVSFLFPVALSPARR